MFRIGQSRDQLRSKEDETDSMYIIHFSGKNNINDLLSFSFCGPI